MFVLRAKLMIIKNFSEEYLEQTVHLCRISMQLDNMTSFLLREKTFGDPDYDPKLTLLAFNSGNEAPVGFIEGVIRSFRSDTRGSGKNKKKKTGYVKLLCVHPDERRKGIAAGLYKRIEKKFKKEGLKRVRVYDSAPNYFMPGVDPMYTEAVCFFAGNGFTKIDDTCNLSADLKDKSFSTENAEKKLLRKNIIIKRAEINEKKEIISWLQKKFPWWIPEVSESFNNDPVTLFIAKHNGKTRAFSAHEVNNKGSGWFGPMGTDKSLRGYGVGDVLLKKSLQDMKDFGFSKAVIPWVGPIQFYMKSVNSKIERVFWRYEKILG